MLPFLHRETGQQYRGDLQDGDIRAVTEPPSRTAVAVIQNGQHTGDWTEPLAPPPPPEWGHFAASRALCPDCERWWRAVDEVNPYRAATLMGFFTHPSPDPNLAQGILDRAMEASPPDQETITAWNTAAQQYYIPALMPEPE